MTWADLYLFCFFAGFLFSVVSMLLGHAHFDTHHGHHHLPHLGAGHHGGTDIAHHHGGAQAGHDSDTSGRSELTPFNMATAAAFLAWFGGTGYLATHYYRLWFLAALALASMSGLVGASIVFWFLAKVLMRDREELDPANFEMIGVLGSVSCPIRPEGIGEILFSQQGFRRASPARSETGSAIPNGIEVVVTRFEDGIAYVRRWDEFSETVDDANATGAGGQ